MSTSNDADVAESIAPAPKKVEKEIESKQKEPVHQTFKEQVDS